MMVVYLVGYDGPNYDGGWQPRAVYFDQGLADQHARDYGLDVWNMVVREVAPPFPDPGAPRPFTREQHDNYCLNGFVWKPYIDAILDGYGTQ